MGVGRNDWQGMKMGTASIDLLLRNFSNKGKEFRRKHRVRQGFYFKDVQEQT